MIDLQQQQVTPIAFTQPEMFKDQINTQLLKSCLNIKRGENFIRTGEHHVLIKCFMFS